MPLEQEVNEAVLFQRIVRGVFNSVEEPAEGLGIGWRPKSIRLSYTPRRKENVEYKQVGQLGSPILDLMGSWGTPGKSVR